MADESGEGTAPEEGTKAAQAAEPVAGEGQADDSEPEIGALQRRIAELEESLDRAHRSAAFYDTRRRQAERELEETQRYGFEPVAKKLVTVVDALERALAAATDDGESEGIRDGIAMVLKLLMDALESEGVKAVASVGLPFDPTVHEALAYQAVADATPHHVVAEIQRGYTLNDRLLRAATVLVAAPAAEQDGENGAQVE